MEIKNKSIWQKGFFKDRLRKNEWRWWVFDFGAIVLVVALMVGGLFLPTADEGSNYGLNWNIVSMAISCSIWLTLRKNRKNKDENEN